MFYNRAIKVSSSHNQSYTEIGSVYHGAYLSHILIVPPLRAYSGQGSVLFSSLVYFFYKTLFSFSFWANTSVCLYILFISIVLLFSSLCRDAAWCVQLGYWVYCDAGTIYTFFKVKLCPLILISLLVALSIKNSKVLFSPSVKPDID